MLHLPRQFRHQLCGVTAECVAGCNDGDASWAVSEQARSKLLLAHVPKGSSTNLELQTRFRLWLDAAFGPLLQRVELQAQEAASPGANPVRNRGKRCKALAQGDSYRKGLQALGGSTAQLSPREQKEWASKLLPDRQQADSSGIASWEPATARSC